jgi:hypothetical protein
MDRLRPALVRPEGRLPADEDEVALPGPVVSAATVHADHVKDVEACLIQESQQLGNRRFVELCKKRNLSEHELDVSKEQACSFQRRQLMPLKVELEQHSVANSTLGST